MEVIVKKSIVPLVEKAQTGDNEAMSELYERTYADAYKMAMRLCRDEGDAQDAVQDAFLEIFQSIHKLRDPNSYYLWLSRIVTSKCTRIFRKKRHMTLAPDQIGRLANQIEKKKSFIPHLQLNEMEEQMLIHAFVDELTPTLKETVNCIYFQQWSVEETANYLQVPVGTIKSRLHYARNVLYKKIKQFEEGEGRKIHFYEGISAWIIAKVVLVKASVKKATLHSNLSSVATNAVIGISAVSISVFGVEGAKEVYQSLHEPIQEIAQTIPKQPVKEENTTILSKPLFQANYNNKSYTNPKEAYYEIIRWGQDADYATTLSNEEKMRIQPLYHAIKKRGGPFWEMLLHEGWQSVFE